MGDEYDDDYEDAYDELEQDMYVPGLPDEVAPPDTEENIAAGDRADAAARERAAISLQSRGRSKLARDQVGAQRQAVREERAAVSLQSRGRSKLARDQSSSRWQALDQERAALSLQRRGRGKLARDQAEAHRHALKQERAAVALQSRGRSKLARDRVSARQQQAHPPGAAAAEVAAVPSCGSKPVAASHPQEDVAVVQCAPAVAAEATKPPKSGAAPVRRERVVEPAAHAELSAVGSPTYAVARGPKHIAALSAQRRVNERIAEKLTAAQQEQWQRAFMSEWLTQHPPVLRYPPHVWLHADCPPPEPLRPADSSNIADGEGEVPASAQWHEVHMDNQRAVAFLKAGKLDNALVMLKETEATVRQKLPAQERLQVLPVIMNNLAFFYYRKGKHASAMAYMQRTLQMERRAYGAVDFATHLRMAAVASKLKHHSDSLKHCKAALTVLQQTAGEEEGSSPELRGAFHAHLAVAYHNTAVQLAQTQQLREASAAAKLAQQLATTALPAKHRWVQRISATTRLLQDMHISTSFVNQQVRVPLQSEVTSSDKYI